MRIRVIMNKPKYYQDTDAESVENIIGQEFDVLDYDEELGEVSINSEQHGGIIVLNKEEYEVVEKDK